MCQGEEESGFGDERRNLHDRFPGIGGGEIRYRGAARVFDAPIYTMYVAQGTDIPDDVCVIPIEQKKYARALKRLAEWKMGVNPLETLNVAYDMTDSHPDLTEYDVIA